MKVHSNAVGGDHVGDCSGHNAERYLLICATVMQEWIDDMASFLKGIDKNHLVMCATMGYFGASTPNLVNANPTDMVVIHEGDTRLFPVAQICQGEDSSAIAALAHIDFTDLCVFPATLSAAMVALDTTGRIHWFA